MADFGIIMLGEGKLYLDEGEAGELEIGYVRGGEFNDQLEMRHIEADGKRSFLKGDAIVNTIQPQLTINALEMNSTHLDKLFCGVEVADATGIKTLTRNYAVADTDYLTNVTFVGVTKAGKAVKIKLNNALGEGPVNLAFADKEEVVIPCLFTGNGTSIDDTAAPYEIVLDETA